MGDENTRDAVGGVEAAVAAVAVVALDDDVLVSRNLEAVTTSRLGA